MSQRDTILITHANPEDNAVTSWFASKLATAGYRVWVDLERLRGGADFWDDIDDQLRNRTIKQIVLISKNVGKQGVKKELAIGDIVGKQLGDSGFMIPIRVDDVPFSDFPPELVRRNAHDAFPNWADALAPLLDDLTEAEVPKNSDIDSAIIEQLVRSREIERQKIIEEPEELLSNWFPIAEKRPHLNFFGLSGTEVQKNEWLKSANVPIIEHSGLIASFCDPITLSASGPFKIGMKQRFSIPFDNLVSGKDVDPFPSRAEARRFTVNLMRQHWDNAMEAKGLMSFEYADGKKGWFFPDGLIEGSVKIDLDNGLRVQRVLSGKFKEHRWHLCLVAGPQVWPEPLYRVHANVALTENGVDPLPGKKTQKIRRRLTKSWWNDKWRDMLLASMGWIASDETKLIDIAAGAEDFAITSLPISIETPLSYNDSNTSVIEEDADGVISLSEEINELLDEDKGEDLT